MAAPNNNVTDNNVAVAVDVPNASDDSLKKWRSVVRSPKFRKELATGLVEVDGKVDTKKKSSSKHPTNAVAEMDAFFARGCVGAPQFAYSGGRAPIDVWASLERHDRHKIDTKLAAEAERVLEGMLDRFTTVQRFRNALYYGHPKGKEAAAAARKKRAARRRKKNEKGQKRPRDKGTRGDAPLEEDDEDDGDGDAIGGSRLASERQRKAQKRLEKKMVSLKGERGTVLDQAKAMRRVLAFLAAHGLGRDELVVRVTVGNRLPSIGMLAAPRYAREGRASPHRGGGGNVHDGDDNSRYELWLAADHETFTSAAGLHQFLAHEVGTHLLRWLNEEQQPWHGCREGYNLPPVGRTRAHVATEEGLATCNQLLFSAHPHARLLYAAALRYYAACCASTMSFEQLFAKLERYVPDRVARWKTCVRIRAGASDQAKPGGFGLAQAYFEGAVKIFRSLDTIDFAKLYSGKVTVEDVTGANNCVLRRMKWGRAKLPAWITQRVAGDPASGAVASSADAKRSLASAAARYKRQLHAIARLNGLVDLGGDPARDAKALGANGGAGEAGTADGAADATGAAGAASGEVELGEESDTEMFPEGGAAFLLFERSSLSFGACPKGFLSSLARGKDPEAAIADLMLQTWGDGAVVTKDSPRKGERAGLALLLGSATTGTDDGGAGSGEHHEAPGVDWATFDPAAGVAPVPACEADADGGEDDPFASPVLQGVVGGGATSCALPPGGVADEGAEKGVGVARGPSSALLVAKQKRPSSCALL